MCYLDKYTVIPNKYESLFEKLKIQLIKKILRTRDNIDKKLNTLTLSGHKCKQHIRCSEKLANFTNEILIYFNKSQDLHILSKVNEHSDKGNYVSITNFFGRTINSYEITKKDIEFIQKMLKFNILVGEITDEHYIRNSISNLN